MDRAGAIMKAVESTEKKTEGDGSTGKGASSRYRGAWARVCLLLLYGFSIVLVRGPCVIRSVVSACVLRSNLVRCGHRSAHSASNRLQGKERLLMAKAMEEQAAAGREQRRWQAQELKTREMHREEAAAVQSANTMYDRHMLPLSHVSKLYSDYEAKLQRCVLSL